MLGMQTRKHPPRPLYGRVQGTYPLRSGRCAGLAAHTPLPIGGLKVEGCNPHSVKLKVLQVLVQSALASYPADGLATGRVVGGVN